MLTNTKKIRWLQLEMPGGTTGDDNNIDKNTNNHLNFRMFSTKISFASTLRGEKKYSLIFLYMNFALNIVTRRRKPHFNRSAGAILTRNRITPTVRIKIAKGPLKMGCFKP